MYDMVVVFLQMPIFFSELLHSHSVLKGRNKKSGKSASKKDIEVVRKYKIFQNYFVSYLDFYYHLP